LYPEEWHRSQDEGNLRQGNQTEVADSSDATQVAVARKVAVVAVYTKGVDVSQYQSTVDWPRVKAAGVRFAYLRASMGADGRDTEFERNRRGCHENGIAWGAYHYLRGWQVMAGQAENLIAAVGNDWGDLPPALS